MLIGDVAFVTNKEESTLDLAPLVAISNNEPFMIIKKKKSVPKLQLYSVSYSKE